MLNLEVDEDVFFFVLGRATEGGMTASQLLRQELKVPPARTGNPEFVRSTSSQNQPNTGGSPTNSKDAAEVSAFLSSPTFLVHPDGIGRFLGLLGFVYKRDPNKFDAVLNISGDSRRYFAKSQKELEDSGNSVMPRPIPGSSFWVVGNNSNKMKQDILRRVMQTLGYPRDAISIAIGAIQSRTP